MSALAQALLEFKKEAPTLLKDSDNPHFKSKFASLKAVHRAVDPLLVKHGLVWVTTPGYDKNTGHAVLEYRLIHAESDDEIAAACPLILTKQDPQALGSAITYARRQSLLSVLGLVADEDDDGNAASGKTEKPERKPSPRIPGDRARGILKDAQSKNLYEGTHPGNVFKALLASHGVSKIGELNVDQAEAVEQWLKDA